MKRSWTYRILFLLMVLPMITFAGNPDRQGESGAAELLFNPWARSAGLHSMLTASITGVEAMRLNVAGLGRINSTELLVANTRLFEGTDMKLNAIGLSRKMGENSALGLSLTSVDFGDIPITTSNQPEGTGGTYSPNFFHLGLGYSYTYANKISVGVLFRVISESLPNVSAFGFALDAGVQYVSGERDQFRLGISLRNIGSPMRFGGEGLSYEVNAPNESAQYKITFDTRSEDFELPSVLNIGVSYDFQIREELMIRAVGNFTSNSFSRDQLGGGAEVYIRNFLTLRAGYKLELGAVASERNVYTGFAGGISLYVPVKSLDRKIGIDYAYRATDPFEGTHNIGIRVAL